MPHLKNNYPVIIILFFSVLASFEAWTASMGTRRSGVAVGESPVVVKRRADGLTIAQEKIIEDRHDLQSGNTRIDEKNRDNIFRQNLRQRETKNKRPGQVYSVVEDGITVRKQYPFVGDLPEEVPQETVDKQPPPESKILSDTEKYAKLTPWFRAKLLGKKLPAQKEKIKADLTKPEAKLTQESTGTKTAEPKKTSPDASASVKK